MLSDFDQFFERYEEPMKGTLLYLRELIGNSDDRITEAWKYRMPMFCFNGKMFCYLWVDKDTTEPYIGWVDGKLLDHPALEQGDRARMRIMRFQAEGDLPVDEIREVLDKAIALRSS